MQPALQHGHARGQQPAVGFQLGLARTAQTDAALLALQVGPAAHQPGREVLELGQLDLELALEGARALGEDVEDQAGTVDHPALQQAFQVAFLGRAERMVEDDQLGLGRRDQRLEFLSLARADEEARVGRGARTADAPHHLGAGGLGEQHELLALVGLARRSASDVEIDQHRPFAGLGPLEDERRADGDRPGLDGRNRYGCIVQCASGSAPSVSLVGSRTLRAGTTVEMACL